MRQNTVLLSQQMLFDIYFNLLELLPFLSKHFRLVGYCPNVTAIIIKVSILEMSKKFHFEFSDYICGDFLANLKLQRYRMLLSNSLMHFNSCVILNDF